MSAPGPAFEYASEEVGEAFTEWCGSEGIEARDDQEYRAIRSAFTAGMNEVSRYGRPIPLPADLDAELARAKQIASGLQSATRMLGLAPDFTGCGGPAAAVYWEYFTPARILSLLEGDSR
jgi:hypothetical protein